MSSVVKVDQVWLCPNHAAEYVVHRIDVTPRSLFPYRAVMVRPGNVLFMLLREDYTPVANWRLYKDSY